MSTAPAACTAPVAPHSLGASLAQIISRDRVLTRPIERIAYASDASFYRLIPQAVVLAKGVEEVQGLFQFSRTHRVPMTFRTAGTSLSGQAVTDVILVDVANHWRQSRTFELSVNAFVIVGLLGACAAYRKEDHVVFDLLHARFKPRGQNLMRMLSYSIVIVLFAAGLPGISRYVWTFPAVTSILFIPERFIFASLPILMISTIRYPHLINRYLRRRKSIAQVVAMVIVGLLVPLVGKTELPATKRFAMPWTLQSGSTTPCAGSAFIFVVPIWCQLPRRPGGSYFYQSFELVMDSPVDTHSQQSLVVGQWRRFVFLTLVLSVPALLDVFQFDPLHRWELALLFVAGLSSILFAESVKLKPIHKTIYREGKKG